MSNVLYLTDSTKFRFYEIMLLPMFYWIKNKYMFYENNAKHNIFLKVFKIIIDIFNV